MMIPRKSTTSFVPLAWRRVSLNLKPSLSQANKSMDVFIASSRFCIPRKMLRGRLLLFLLSAMAVTIPCSGFIAERSANVPVAWNVVPCLEIDQEITVDRLSNEQTQVTGIDKTSQSLETKKLTKVTEMTPEDTTREERPELILENTENETRFAKATKEPGINLMEQNTVIDSVALGPRNVILLLITGLEQDRDNFWKYFKALHQFSTEGFFQNCHNSEIDGPRFPLDDMLISGSKDKECDCDRLLRSNISGLLSWAQDVKGMTTGTMFNTMIPPFSGYEELMGIPKRFEEIDESNTKPEVRRDLHLTDLGKSNNHVSPLTFTPNIREDGVARYASGGHWSLLAGQQADTVPRPRTSLEDASQGVDDLGSSFSDQERHCERLSEFRLQNSSTRSYPTSDRSVQDSLSERGRESVSRRDRKIRQ